MLKPEYIEAIETRLRWQRWLRKPTTPTEWTQNFHRAPRHSYAVPVDEGSLFVMAPKFWDLVEQARKTIPDDITFEAPWVLAPIGWLWFPQPFVMPLIQGQRERMMSMTPHEQIAAITVAGFGPDDLDKNGDHSAHFPSQKMITLVQEWAQVLPQEQGEALLKVFHELANGIDLRTYDVAVAQVFQRAYREQWKFGQRLRMYAMGWYLTTHKPPHLMGSYVSSGLGEGVWPDLSVFFYGMTDTRSFTPLSHFGIQFDGALGPRIESFERWAARGHERDPLITDAPYEDPDGMWRHEVTLAYTVFYLMAQRLAVTPRIETDRHTRRRAEREQQKAPDYIQVVTLRRLEAARQRDPHGHEVDWQWQWTVEPHWRWQWYPSANQHKRILIPLYTKGPPDKPFKAPGGKLFAARR
jgi:hypothetical protein